MQWQQPFVHEIVTVHVSYSSKLLPSLIKSDPRWALSINSVLLRG